MQRFASIAVMTVLLAGPVVAEVPAPSSVPAAAPSAGAPIGSVAATPPVKLTKGWMVKAVRATDIAELQQSGMVVLPKPPQAQSNIEDFGEFRSRGAGPLTVDDIAAAKIKIPTGTAPGLIAEALLDIAEPGDYYLALQLDAPAQQAPETFVTLDLLANGNSVVTGNSVMRYGPGEAAQVISDTRRLQGLKPGRYALRLAYSCSQRDALAKLAMPLDNMGKASLRPCPAITLLVRGPKDRSLRPAKETEIGHDEG